MHDARLNSNDELTFCFHVETEEDMIRLGVAFANALSPENIPFAREIVIAADGETDSGKTTFFRSLFNALGIDCRNEDINAAPFMAETDDMSLCHYDAIDYPDFEPDIRAGSDLTVVCVEHSENENLDINFAFDFAVHPNGARFVTLSCDAEEAEQEGFQIFMEQAEDMALL